MEGQGAWRFVFELEDKLEDTKLKLESARKDLAENEEKAQKYDNSTYHTSCLVVGVSYCCSDI